jgi:hypothetical protein
MLRAIRKRQGNATRFSYSNFKLQSVMTLLSPFSPSTAVHHCDFNINAICTHRPRPSLFYKPAPDY